MDLSFLCFATGAIFWQDEIREEGMQMEKTKRRLEEIADEKYATFMRKLVPMIDPHRVVGVRKPDWVRIWKDLNHQEREVFLHERHHAFLEEDLMHVYALNAMTQEEKAKEALNQFEDRINCWALTDGLTFPHLSDEVLLSMARERFDDSRSGSRRLAILWIMKRALKREDAARWIEDALSVAGEEKEIIDARGWMLCEALIVNEKAALPFYKADRAEKQVLLRAISKCIDSRRISPERKNALRELRKELK